MDNSATCSGSASLPDWIPEPNERALAHFLCAALYQEEPEVHLRGVVLAVQISHLRECMLAVSSVSQTIWVVFRGTQQLQDFVTDLSTVEEGIDRAFAHAAVQRYTNRLSHYSVLSTLLDNRDYDGYKIRVTGHSMGAACAQLFTFLALEGLAEYLAKCKKGETRNPKIATITFGSPFWASQKIQKIIKDHGWSSLFVSIVNRGDCVPALTNISDAFGTNQRRSIPENVRRFISESHVPGLTALDFQSSAFKCFIGWTSANKYLFSSSSYVPVGVYEYIQLQLSSNVVFQITNSTV